MRLKTIKKDIWAFYAICDSDESCPLLDWFNTIPRNQDAFKKRLLAIIDKTATDRHGPRLLPVEISHIVDNKHAIYEFIAGRLRLLWFYSPNERKVIICSIGFSKKTQKTPRKYVAAAIRDKNAYTKAVNDKDIRFLKEKNDDQT